MPNGSEYINGARAYRQIKLRSDGSLDPAFTAFTTTNPLTPLQVFADGRLLALEEGLNRFVRLLPNGATDPGFTPSPLEHLHRLQTSLLLRDGRVLIAVTPPTTDSYRSRIYMLGANGGVDPGFTSYTPPFYVSDMAEQADGKILLSTQLLSSSSVHPSIVRLNRDGTVDTTLNTLASLPTNAFNAVVVVPLPDGKIVVGSAAKIVRLQPDGALDSSFTTDATPRTRFERLHLSNTRKHLYFFDNESGTTPSALRRIGVDGRIDASFNIASDASPSDAGAPRVVSWDDTAFYIGGRLKNERVLARLFLARTDARGEIDPRFILPRFATGVVTHLGFLRQPDGTYLFSGACDYINGVPHTSTRANTVRFHADGSLDRSFDATSVSSPTSFATAVPLGVQPSGRILVSVESQLWRLQPNGARDTSFPTPEGQIYRIAMAPDGSFVVDPSSGIGFARYSADGVRDTTLDASNAAGDVALVAPDGKILLFSTATGGVSRLLSNGARDSTFSIPASMVSRYSSLAMLANGNVLAWSHLSVPFALNPEYSLRMAVFDSTGRRIYHAETASDLRSIAALAKDVVTANGGGHVRLAISSTTVSPHVSTGVIDIQGDDITIAPRPGAYSGEEREMLPFRRYRAGKSGLLANHAPVIFVHPQTYAISRGASISLSVSMYGEAPFTCQWYKDGIPIDTLHTTSSTDALRIANVQEASLGDYSVEVRNAHGVTHSAAGRISLAGPPVVTQQPPASLNVSPGQTLLLSLSATGGNLSIHWRRNGETINYDSGLAAGSHTALVPIVGTTQSGTYVAEIANSAGTVTSRTVNVTVMPEAKPSQLMNMSVRTAVGTGDQALILGFVVAGASRSPTTLLIRGTGPALEAFGITGRLPNPRLRLYEGSRLIEENDDWGGNREAIALGARLGAFAIPNAASKDAVIVPSALSSGAFTVVLDDPQGLTGTALAEIYADPATPAIPSARLANLSSRSHLSARANPLVAGFVISGETARTVLVRGIGPGLAPFGVTNTQPVVDLALFDAQGRPLAEAMQHPGSTAAFFERVGAFAIDAGDIRNRAILMTLPPGAYTAQVRGVADTPGFAMIEVYEVP